MAKFNYRQSCLVPEDDAASLWDCWCRECIALQRDGDDSYRLSSYWPEHIEVEPSFEEQREHFIMALVEYFGAAAPRGYRWEAFRDQYIEEVDPARWSTAVSAAQRAMADWQVVDPAGTSEY